MSGASTLSIIVSGSSDMIRHVTAALFFALFSTFGSSPVRADDLIVGKKTFVLPSYTTVVGDTIKSVKVGWEAAGTLNADKSNPDDALLFGHEPHSANTVRKTRQPVIGMQ
jgi:hypothetical protein